MIGMTSSSNESASDYFRGNKLDEFKLCSTTGCRKAGGHQGRSTRDRVGDAELTAMSPSAFQTKVADHFQFEDPVSYQLQSISSLRNATTPETSTACEISFVMNFPGLRFSDGYSHLQHVAEFLAAFR